jgi:hypothetical protein
VRVCGHCNNAVLRTDRGVDSLGKVADLVPMESPIKLFSEGHFGSTTFLVVGMAQIRGQAGGLWQEWYAKFDGGKWGWLAEAQGRFYLTFEEPWIAAPRDVTPGQVIAIPVRGQPHPCTVGEVSTATYVGATGELPFKLVPNGTFRYADLSDGRGTFATLDFDDGSEPPTLYVGAQIPLADLRLTGGEVGPPAGLPEAQIKSTRLACPNCNAPIELRAPGESLRVVCGHCNNLIDTSSGALSVLGKLAQKADPRIPLGMTGTFAEGEMTVIGFVQRSACVDGEWWPFEEYLLYKPGIGFRWLVNSDGHWSYVQPIATGAVETDIKGCKYDGVSFRRYQQAQLRVDEVLGEFYWQVQVGEVVESEDCIAPPAMVSRESGQTEENWSLGTYMTVKEVRAAFAGKELPLGIPDGIAPNQPDSWTVASNGMSLAFMALMVLGIVFAAMAKDQVKYTHDFTVPGTMGGTAPTTPTPAVSNVDPISLPECVEYKAVYDAAMTCESTRDSRDLLKTLYDSTMVVNDRDILRVSCKTGIDSVRAMAAGCVLPDHDAIAAAQPAGSDAGSGAAPTVSELNAFFSDPIALDGGRNIELDFDAAPLDNNWVYVAADLVDDSTGQIVTVDGNIEHYSGVEDGESWSEGTRHTHEVIGPQKAGSYTLRVEGQYGGVGALPMTVTLKQGVFRGRYLALAMLALGIPLLLVGLVSWSHEKKRWENSTSGKAPIRPITILVMTFAGVFYAIGAIIKAAAESSSDD